MKKLSLGLIVLALTCSTSIAADLEIVGKIEQPITVLKNKNFQANTPKNVTLLDIILSAKAQSIIAKRVEKEQLAKLQHIESQGSGKQIQLDMNGVPVLNQGNHGTCVTFATTAAIDAALGKGDYISQLCQLTLGRYLENNGYTSSGWNGSWGRIVLSQMDVFGLVTKANQRLLGCGGMTEYPLSGEDPTDDLSVADYHLMSEVVPKNKISWSSVLDVYDVTSDQIDTEQILAKVKQALTAGDRLTFGVLLADVNQGIAGAIGSHNEKFDSWVLTPEIANDINNQEEFAGHEMIITGFADSAIAVDEKGRVYRGLLTLRNSWGSNIGDKGNFYMSYDYFKALLLEVQRIRHLV